MAADKKPQNKQPQKKKQKAGKATSLKNLLTFIFVIVIAASVGVYYMSITQLESYAVEVSHKVVDSEASSTLVQGLQALQTQLRSDEALVSKADNIFATEDNYQTRAARDVQNYAELADLSISETSFSSEGNSDSERDFTVKFSSSVPYTDFIAFLQGVEGNIPIIKVKNMTLKGDESNRANVTVENLTMSILVR